MLLESFGASSLSAGMRDGGVADGFLETLKYLDHFHVENMDERSGSCLQEMKIKWNGMAEFYAIRK